MVLRSFALFLALSLATYAVGCRTTSDDPTGGSAVLDDEGVVPHQVRRFEVWMGILKQTLAASSSLDDAADRLVFGENRIAAFNLQALGRLYGDEAPLFKDMRKTFKRLEDAIGTYDKWNNVLRKAEMNGAGETALTLLRQKKRDAKDALKDLLTEDGYLADPPYLARLTTDLQAFSWRSYEDDKTLMLGKLTSELTDIIDASWDFSFLEEGNGLHEYRRKLRWFLIEARVLNGMVTLKPASEGCPAEEFAGLVSTPLASSKYGKLPPSQYETNPRSITPCLFLAVVKAVEDVGQIKDQVEVDNNQSGTTSDDVPPLVKAKMLEIHQKLIDAAVFSRLREELMAP